MARVKFDITFNPVIDPRFPEVAARVYIEKKVANLRGINTGFFEGGAHSIGSGKMLLDDNGEITMDLDLDGFGQKLPSNEKHMLHKALTAIAQLVISHGQSGMLSIQDTQD